MSHGPTNGARATRSPTISGFRNRVSPSRSSGAGRTPLHRRLLRRSAASAASVTLDALIASRPTELLGCGVGRRFSDQLPYLLKIIAPAALLSLQVHPNLNEAASGFALEDASGVDRQAPHRASLPSVQML